MTADTMVMLVAISIADGTATLVVTLVATLVATLVVTSIADGMAMLVATSIAGGTAMGVATLVGRIMTGEATVVGRTTGRISFENVRTVKAFGLDWLRGGPRPCKRRNGARSVGCLR
jgi:hypothetical protein